MVNYIVAHSTPVQISAGGDGQYSQGFATPLQCYVAEWR